MQQGVISTCFKRFTGYAAAFGGIAAIMVKILSPGSLPSFLAAYLISYMFTGSNFFIVSKIDLQDHSRFFKFFGWSFSLRFILAVGAIVIGFKVINNHQIFFTVSFIISYICHSVIEINFLNKILETDT